MLVVSSAALLLTRLAPGDVTAQLGPFASAGEIAGTRARFDLDRSPGAQWVAWVARAVRFDFGDSFLYNRPVADSSCRAAVNTAVLAVAALALATLVGIPLGIFTGSRRGAGAALIARRSLVCLSVPPLLTSLLLVFIAATHGLASGRRHDVGWCASTLGWSAWLADVAMHLPLPALALALPIAATFERLQSQSMTEALHQPFALAAVARGCRAARRHHAPRVARVAAADLRRLRPGDRRAALGVVRRGVRDRVAGPGPADVRGAARARHLSRGRMRGDGRTLSRARQPDRRPAAGRGGSARPRSGRRA